MNDRYQLLAFCATLSALVAVFIAALIAGSLAPAVLGKIEVFGLGTITGGLIGVLKLPQRTATPSESDAPAPVTVTNDPANPVPVATKE